MPFLNIVKLVLVKIILCFGLVILFSATALLSSTPLQAKKTQILAFVSDRSAPTLVSGAHQFLQSQNSNLTDNSEKVRVEIRTVTQLTQMQTSEIQQLVTLSDGILILSVFGDQVERLLNLNYSSKQTRIVLQTDRRLLKLHQDIKGQIFNHANLSELTTLFKDAETNIEINTFIEQQTQAWPNYHYWLKARGLWSNRSLENASNLFNLTYQLSNSKNISSVEKILIQPVSSIRFYSHEKNKTSQLVSKKIKIEQLSNQLALSNLPIIWILDHDAGDRPGDWQLHQKFCQTQKWQCFSVLARWGNPSVKAIETIQQLMQNKVLKNRPWAILSLQDFVIGGGDGRQDITQRFIEMNVPIFKGIRLTEWQQAEWQLSAQGLPTDSVHYRVAMPELQGIAQPQVLAHASQNRHDEITGAQLSISQPDIIEVNRFAERVLAWLTLQTKSNHEKKVAIIYYNHPPGRHNIGADNLNVIDSLWEILNHLKAQGYQTGELPDNQKELLDLLQQRGVNLPNDKQALSEHAAHGLTISQTTYQTWFKQLPESVQAEMTNGPLGKLHELLKQELSRLPEHTQQTARQLRLKTLRERVNNTISDIHHALDGIRHVGRSRALNLLEQLQQSYLQQLSNAQTATTLNWSTSEQLLNALLSMKIEGIKGWGEIPGEVMVWQNNILLPGLQFGNIFIGPQPPRGWEIHEELLHANMSFPPPHQYLAFYQYLANEFKADALIHLGRHSTYEFLPKKSVGLSAEDYPSLLLGKLPSIYPYIVDGVGEGIQAKRRGLAVIVDHLTPPLAATELYDDLLELRQLIESAEAASDDNTRALAIKSLRHQIDVLNLREELIASMDEELKVRGVGFEQIDDDFLLHEVGHYLTNIQEKFMPLGLHVFGKNWSNQAVETMLKSMADSQPIQQKWRANLVKSPKAEINSLLNALNGRFVPPGKGNDPIRTNDALPTGRNFYALNGSLLPTKVGFNIGKMLAEKARNQPQTDSTLTPKEKNKQAIILWASDAVRDEGAMIAFGMSLLGVEPQWNSRGIIKGLKRLPLSEKTPTRMDVVFTTSGLFRDLYGEHIKLLDKATLLALDASSDLIKQKYPALTVALHAALEPLAEWKKGGNDPLTKNMVAANWVNEARELLQQMPNATPEIIGRQASLRIFGSAPGSYGAGVNRIVERSGSWQERKEIGQIYLKRMGHVYANNIHGESAQTLFKQQLSKVETTFLGRASHLYGLMDNNDAFDYLGGLNLAIETVTGKQPKSQVINHANAQQIKMEPLNKALLSELRSRFLNPQWIKPLMQQDYAGARTMGSEFIEYLWGWQVTSPEIINDWVWQEVKSVYIDDSHQLALDDFLSKDHNRYVQTNILAVMLVAIEKNFWQADEETRKQLAQQFTNNIIEHGIPGSGHTHANHSIYEFIQPFLTQEQQRNLNQKLDQSRLPPKASEPQVKHVQEISVNQPLENNHRPDKNISSSTERKNHSNSQQTQNNLMFYLLLITIFIIVLGFVRTITRKS